MATPLSLNDLKPTASPALLFDDDVEGVVQHVVVHPLVLLQVLDHHTRRQEAAGRVIGTLLGRRDGSAVEVTNCFAVPHAERGEEVAIGKDFNKTMLGLHMRTNRKEAVVGWYASSSSPASASDTDSSSNNELMSNTSSLIHDFYASETDEGDPVHLIVDTRLQQDTLSIRAYKSAPVVLQGESLGNLFHELRLTLKSNEPETICLQEMIKSNNKASVGDNGDTASADDVSGLIVSMEKLYELLETACHYVEQVLAGNITPDPEVGRKIADTLATVPRTRPEIMDKLFHDSLQDLLMVSYLSNLTRTQLTIAEKLNASLGV